MAGGGHGRGTEDGTGDKAGTLGLKLLGDGGCGVRVDGGAVDEELVGERGAAGDAGVDDGLDGGVVADTGEDDIGLGDGLGDGVGDGGVGSRGLEFLGAGDVAVVDD